MSDGLPIPAHYDATRVGQVWRVPYQQRAEEAQAWARQHDIKPAELDRRRICLVAVDVQNTFCIPDFELFVAGRSGSGAVVDNRRLCEFIYRNLGLITQIFPTMDTHQAMQIFHALFLVDQRGRQPEPFTLVSVDDVERGRWRVNPAVAHHLSLDVDYAQRHLLHYVRALKQGGKYDLTIWPYHAMLGGIGHALVSAIEEALFFHAVARSTQPEFQVKGDLPLTEHYSVVAPEVRVDPEGRPIGGRNGAFIQELATYDVVIIAGQAKSHCVAWTVDDLLVDSYVQAAGLARRVYLLEDCTSPVVVPGAVDYTEQADAAFRRFADAGMHVVRSTDPIEDWPVVSA